MLGIGIEIVARCLLVALFLPFSALDKLLNFEQATAQAAQAVKAQNLARLLILAGLSVEVFMSAAVLTGILDRLAAFILAGYCAVTAILWKPFWKSADFRLRGPSRGREMFWDFLKNFAVAGGFLMLVGADAATLESFIHHPLASSQPYARPSGASPP